MYYIPTPVHTPVALYPDHDMLPFFSSSPGLPTEMFEPELHRIREVRFSPKLNIKTRPAEKDPVWPILMGLRTMNLPVLAHVSAFCDCWGPGIWHHPRQMWIQITTLPTETNGAGIPITISSINGAKTVMCLWKSDANALSPYELLKTRLESYQPEFWRTFFVGQLMAEKITAETNACMALEKAGEIAKLFSNVPCD